MEGEHAIDIGSGAGFPGVCLKIIEPGVHLTLLDASAKRTSFLAKVRADLQLEKVEIVRGRAERLAHDTAFREQFDLATVRAVVRLARAIEIGLPFVRVGGCLVMAWGKASHDDAEAAERIGLLMGGGRPDIHSGVLEGIPIRGSVVVLPKANRTEQRYPRGRTRGD